MFYSLAKPLRPELFGAQTGKCGCELNFAPESLASASADFPRRLREARAFQRIPRAKSPCDDKVGPTTYPSESGFARQYLRAMPFQTSDVCRFGGGSP